MKARAEWTGLVLERGQGKEFLTLMGSQGILASWSLALLAFGIGTKHEEDCPRLA